MSIDTHIDVNQSCVKQWCPEKADEFRRATRRKFHLEKRANYKHTSIENKENLKAMSYNYKRIMDNALKIIETKSHENSQCCVLQTLESNGKI